GNDEAHIGTSGCESDCSLEIRYSFGAGRALEQTTRSTEQIPVNVIRAQCEQVIEQADRPGIIEEPPARETRACESGNVVRRGCEPGCVACLDSGFRIRMCWQHEGSHTRVVADGIGIATKQQFGFDASTIALHLSWLRLDHAREFADRVSVASFVDVDLSLLRTTLPRGGDCAKNRCEEQ